MKKDALRNFAKFTGKHLYQRLFFNNVAGLPLAQVFSCEFCEISKNTFFTENLRTTASVYSSFSGVNSAFLGLLLLESSVTSDKSKGNVNNYKLYANNF